MSTVRSLNNRHQLAAYLYAAGKSIAEICELLSYSPVHLRVIAASPLFKARVTEIQREVGSRMVTDITRFNELLEQEAIPSLRTLAELRDAPSDPDLNRVQLQAAGMILDHVEKRQRANREKTVNVAVLPESAIEQMARVMAECAGNAIAIPTTVVDAPRVATRSIDDLPDRDEDAA